MTLNEAEHGIGPYDQMLECQDCAKQFVWTEGEQRFYAQNAFTSPRRCKPCREAKRAARDARW